MRILYITSVALLGSGISVMVFADDPAAFPVSPHAAAGSHSPNGDGASRARIKAPYRLIYNNDTTNTAGISSPWHKDGDGLNTVVLKLESGNDLRVVYLDAGVPVQLQTRAGESSP